MIALGSELPNMLKRSSLGSKGKASIKRASDVSRAHLGTLGSNDEWRGDTLESPTLLFDQP